MIGWLEAPLAGVCSYDKGHTFPAGADVLVVQGPTWRKVYCQACGMSRWNGAEAGLLPPPEVRSIRLGDLLNVHAFDPRKAAANDRDPEDDISFDPAKF